MKKTAVYILLGLTLVSFSVVTSSAVTYKKYYEGLPDYEKNSPFTSSDRRLHNHLASALKTAAENDKACAAVSISQYFPPLESNLCNASASTKIKAILSKIAPSLHPKNLALWKADLDSDGEPELLVGYLTSLSEVDPYFTLWLMKNE